MGIMPNMLNLAKVAKSREYPCFQKISGKITEKNPDKFLDLIFWVQNQFQWLKSSGNDAPYMEIGEKKQIPENFQIFRIFPEKNPEKWEIWNSEFKIKFCDLNWVGKIPYILKLAKN